MASKKKYGLRKLKSVPKLSKKSLLVTLDVTSLYTNIPHADGIDACRHYLDKENNNSKLSTDEICSLIKLTLENNHFQFSGENYVQTLGTAMVSSMAPAYASLFMGKLETDFLESYHLKPTAWLRFLDDIFMIWDHSLADLNDFIKKLNAYHPTIKVTYNVSENNVSFLDVTVLKKESNNISTDIYIKSTDVHQYLEYSSCHPNKCKEGIPFSQAKRYRRIISDDGKFQESLDNLEQYFKNRNYPDNVIKTAFEKVSSSTQDEALINKNTDINSSQLIPFVIPYNPSLPHLGLTINKYWDLLKLSNNNSVQQLYNYKPVLAYKRPKNLQDYLTHSSLNKKSLDCKTSRCNRRRCTHCDSIIESDAFTSTNTGKTFKIFFGGNCTSSDVIYLITCKRCKVQYVGQTHQLVSKR
ncbi:uncharacterized protein LOC128551780 [Mercenaria mercenaria]|uniref:uncharacterized protein LOC128551780 n=1 Tax=Mercenaria mercenaria TaxID=6596 RepID=UPI00234F523F|nr:uncharacterized protein LOC128551780 [Mercenaria mercenaria]